MILVRTQQEFRQRQDPGFCYLCGKTWLPGDKKSADHVLPGNIFLPEDRKDVFVLLSHPECNASKGPWDERIGQVFKLLHGTLPAERRAHKLNLVMLDEVTTGKEYGAVGGLDLDRTILGWLMGFHAVLYRQWLSHKTLWSLSAPFSYFTDPSVIEPIPVVHTKLVETIKANRLAGCVDRVHAWNGKCRYECVWTFLDDKRTAVCVFALDIYDWSLLGATDRTPRRSCVGLYHANPSIPRNASVATSVSFPFSNRQPLDAFAD